MATPQQQEALFREGIVDLGVQAYKLGQITTFCDRVLGGVGHMLVRPHACVGHMLVDHVNPNSVHSVLAAEYQKKTAEQPHLTINLKPFDASASRVAVMCVGELRTVRNLTHEVF